MHGATGIMDGATEIMDEATGIRDERTDGLFDHVILRRTRVELDQLRLVVIREMACSSSKMVFPVPAPLLRLRTNIANVTLARAFADRHNLSYLHLILETAKLQKHIFSALRTSHAYLVV
jgi:hypothetical protein